MIDFRLKVFCSVARHLSFTKASKELLVTQPAISKHIQELESEYRTLLFERKSSGISLTPAGELLLIHAEGILNAYRKLDTEMNLLLSYPSEKLRLGATPTLAQHLLSNGLTELQERIQPIELSLLCDNAQAIERAVAAGVIELGLIEGERQEQGLCYTPVHWGKSGNSQAFYFVQKEGAPKGLATILMHYIACHF